MKVVIAVGLVSLLAACGLQPGRAPVCSVAVGPYGGCNNADKNWDPPKVAEKEPEPEKPAPEPEKPTEPIKPADPVKPEPEKPGKPGHGHGKGDRDHDGPRGGGRNGEGDRDHRGGHDRDNKDKDN